jgi:hypothetical protein
LTSSPAVPEGADHILELIQYNTPAARRRVAPHPWDTGAAHVALSVDNIDGAVEEMTHHAWKLADAVVLSIFAKPRCVHPRLGGLHD